MNSRRDLKINQYLKQGLVNTPTMTLHPEIALVAIDWIIFVHNGFLRKLENTELDWKHQKSFIGWTMWSQIVMHLATVRGRTSSTKQREWRTINVNIPERACGRVSSSSKLHLSMDDNSVWIHLFKYVQSWRNFKLNIINFGMWLQPCQM